MHNAQDILQLNNPLKYFLIFPRPHSPDSGHRDLHSRSHSSHSYNYGYKRSPTPSSSSSPRTGHHSRSKASSDHRKTSHHSRHYSKKSTSSRHSSRRRGESSQREAGSSRTSSPSYPYARQANKTSSPKMDGQQYLQWKHEYKDWCEKYYNSYVGHFNQPPPPSPFPQWLEREGSRNHSHTNSESRDHLQGKGTDWIDPSPPSQSSSDSRSPPSHPSNERRSTPSQSSRDRHCSSSHLSIDSHSPPSQSSRDSCSAASRDKDQLRTYQRRCAEKQSHLIVMLPTPEESRKDVKQLITTNFKNLRNLKYDQKRVKKYEEDKEKESSSPCAADSTGGLRKDKRTNSTGASICKDVDTSQEVAAATEVLELTQLIVKPDKHSDKDSEIYVREERKLEIEKGWRRGKYSDSRQYEERQCKDKSSKGEGRVEMGRYRISGGSKATDSESENRKRKAEDVERSSVKAESYKFLQTDIAEVPEIHRSDSLNPFQTKKSKIEKKKEGKSGPLSARDIWEGEVKVKPQKKINININIDGKMMEEKTETPSFSVASITGKTTEEIKKSIGEEENERGALVWKKATFRDNVGQTKEDGEGKDLASWSCAVRTAEKQKKGRKELWEECDGMKVTDEKSSIKGRQEEGRSVRNDSGGQGIGELVAGNQKEKVDGEQNRGVSPWESKAKIGSLEGLKWRIEEEEDMRSKSSRKRNESHHDGPNTTEVVERSEKEKMANREKRCRQLVNLPSLCKHGAGPPVWFTDVFYVYCSCHEDRQERKTMVKTMTSVSQDRAAGTKDELVLMKVPQSKEEEESEEEEEQDEVEFGVQIDAPTASVPSSPVSVAPSSGKDRAGAREGMMDKEKGKESEGLREGQRESKTTKERTREEEKGRSSKRDGRYTSHPYLYLTSRDTERRDRQLGDDQGSNKSSCSPGEESLCCSGWESSTVREWPDQNAQQTHRDMFPDLKIKDKDHSHCYHSPQDSPGNFPHHHRPAWTHHSSPSFSQGKVMEGDLYSGFSGGWKLGKPTTSSPGQELMQDRSEKVSKLEKEWNQKRVDERMIEDLCEQGDRQDGQSEWEGWRELEEGERSSSSSGSSSKSVDSSASPESSSDNSRKEGKTKPKKKKRRAIPELPEGGEQKKHKMSEKNRDRGEGRSSGVVDDMEREGRQLT